MMHYATTMLDEALRDAILASYSADERIPNGLHVGVMNGIAHLAGIVDLPAQRAAAEELAGQVSGIRGVVNRIKAPGSPSPAREINLKLKHKKKS